jgi:hypothetical protein
MPYLCVRAAMGGKYSSGRAEVVGRVGLAANDEYEFRSGCELRRAWLLPHVNGSDLIFSRISNRAEKYSIAGTRVDIGRNLDCNPCSDWSHFGLLAGAATHRCIGIDSRSD